MEPSLLVSRLVEGDKHAAAEVRGLVARLRAADRAAGASVLDALADAARTGSAAATTVLVELVLSLGLAQRQIREVLFDDADADDAEQLTALTVALRIGSFRGEAPFLAWLGRVARNEAITVLRRRRPAVPLEDEHIEQASTVVERLSSLVASRGRVHAAIDALPTLHAEVVRLREIEGLDYGEIARRLGVPIGTVRSRLARAREALVAELRDD